MNKNLVVLSGAGISAESGIKTFRDHDGLWENHRIEDVASIEGWYKNPDLVLEFYNIRRKQASEVKPNRGHEILVELEQFFNVQIITQNVDNLHERAGSTSVLHLHGELSKVRSFDNEKLIYEIGGEAIRLGDKAEDGAQLRPHIVWFGEAVPMIEPAIKICEQADIFIVVGTSLQVYPAAGLLDYVPRNAEIFVVDPNMPNYRHTKKNVTFIEEIGSIGLQKIKEFLLKDIQ